MEESTTISTGNRMRGRILHYFRAVISLAGLAGMLLSMCGCTTTKYIPVESVRTEVRDHERVRIDTVIEADTRFVYVNGDTVRDYRTRWRERIRDVYDTVYVCKTDTVTRTKTVMVSKKPTAWQRIRDTAGGVSFGILVLLVVVLLLRLLPGIAHKSKQ